MDCCKQNKTERDDSQKRALINRLSRIEGQVRGVRTMIEENAYCVDVLTQVSAISSALSAFNRELLCMHMDSCVKADILAGGEEKLSELSEVLKKIIK